MRKLILGSLLLIILTACGTDTTAIDRKELDPVDLSSNVSMVHVYRLTRDIEEDSDKYGFDCFYGQLVITGSDYIVIRIDNGADLHLLPPYVVADHVVEALDEDCMTHYGININNDVARSK